MAEISQKKIEREIRRAERARRIFDKHYRHAIIAVVAIKTAMLVVALTLIWGSEGGWKFSTFAGNIAASMVVVMVVLAIRRRILPARYKV